MTALLVAVWVVTAGWAYAAVRTHLLAIGRSRMAVRNGAARVRIVLIFSVVAAVAVIAGLAVVSPRKAVVVAPLLLVPAVAGLRSSLPALGRLIRALHADPWGPSDPPIRGAAADPVITVPVTAALACSLTAPLVLTGGWPSAIIAYGLSATAAGTLGLLAPRHRTARVRAGLLRRVVVQAATTVEPATGYQAIGSTTAGSVPDETAGQAVTEHAA